MSSPFSVRLRRYNEDDAAWETAYTFAANPFISPEHSYEHDDQEPPRVTTVKKTWKLEFRLYGADDEDTIEKWTEIRDVIEGSSPINGVQLLHFDTVVEEISSEGDYDEVKVERFASPQEDLQWQTGMTATLQVSGVKRIATVEGDTISALTQTLTYSYDDSGLLTKTLAGDVTVVSGSAEEKARTLGLSIPSSFFAYVTRGPEGVDVEVLNRADTRARFTSIIQESGSALPGGVAPGFSLNIRTRTEDGDEITTTTVEARGPEAFAAVKSKRPTGRLVEELEHDDFRRTARAVYISKKQATGASQVKRQVFRASGGGQQILYTERDGSRTPVEHVGPFLSVLIDEEITLEVTGQKGTIDYKLPAALSGSGVREDTSGFSAVGPLRSEKGKDLSADRWSLTVKRRYTARSFYGAFTVMVKSAFEPGEASNLDAEARRRDDGITA